MNAKSGNGSSGNFIWGVVAGLIAILGAGGLYLSGVFNGPQAPQEQTAAVSAPESQQPAEDAAPAADEAETNTDSTQTTENADDTPSEQADADTADTLTNEASATGAETASGDADSSGDELTAVVPPELDQIFVETDGNALLSGNAEPGSQVQVLLDGEPLHEFTVDDSGQFAEFVAIPFSEEAQGLTLETSNGGQTARSDDYLIAALPEPAGEQIAAADAAVQAEGTPVGEGEQSTPSGGSEAEAQSEATAAAQTDETLAEDAGEDQQVAVLRSGEEGVELVQPPASQGDTPDQIALDTIGYSETGDVRLTGRVTDGSAVRLYLNNRLVADLTPAEDGNWRGDLEGVDPGVYTLRVDEVNTDGTVISRLETPFKREPVEVLQSAEAVAGDNAPDQAPPIRSVTVQKGDTLWAISRERFGDGILYVKLFEANRNLIRDPDLIYPGQIFTIPE